jgi:alanyl aminopeptidase
MRPFLSLALFCVVLSAAVPPKLRLGDEIRPVKYAAELTLVPGAATFDGNIDIDVTLARPASLVWLNATELKIGKATVTHNGKTQIAALEPGNDEFIGLRVPAEIPAGPATLHIQYQGKISPKDSAGVFQGKDGEETYLYTQFEATDARRPSQASISPISKRHGNSPCISARPTAPSATRRSFQRPASPTA